MLAGVPLLRSGADGFEPRPMEQIEALAGRAYGADIDTAKLTAGLGVVARALNAGDAARAMTAAVLLKLPDLDWAGAVRIAQAEDMLLKYSEDQPRDWHGRWTDGDDGAEGYSSDIAHQNGFQTVQEFLPWLGDALALGGRLPFWIRSLPKEIREMPRERIPRLSGKEQSDDIPSWARAQGLKPKIGEDSGSFARRVMDDRWGPGRWDNIPDRLSEFRQLQKHADRAFRIPQDIIDRYGGV